MSPEEKQAFDELASEVADMKQFIERHFNPDGTPKNNPLVIEAEDTTTTPAGSIRIITNKGPKNVLIA